MGEEQIFKEHFQMHPLYLPMTTRRTMDSAKLDNTARSVVRGQEKPHFRDLCTDSPAR